MKKSAWIALGALAVAAAMPAATPARAAVAVGVTTTVPADACVKYRTRHHGRVVVAKYAYCNEPVWTGEPIVYEGVTYRENLHFRTHNGHRQFWIKGRWIDHD